MKLSIDKWPEVERWVLAALDYADDDRDRFLSENCPAELRPLVVTLIRGLLDPDSEEGRLLDESSIQDAIGLATAEMAKQEFRQKGEPPGTLKEIGGYAVEHPLGRGGMGCVYLCKKKTSRSSARPGIVTAQTVALKVLRKDLMTDEAVLRFRRERVMLAAVDSPHVPDLLDAGTTADGRPYYVMEFVDGEPILEYIARRNLALRARLELFEKVCHAVSDVHDHLIIHRDIKPPNLFVTSKDDAEHIMLLDFGLATLLNFDGYSGDGSAEPGEASNTDRSMLTLTQDDTAPHTPEYAAPEQRAGREATTASDIYALGVLLCRIATRDEARPPEGFPFCENIYAGDDEVCCVHGICRLAAQKNMDMRIATAKELGRAAGEVRRSL